MCFAANASRHLPLTEKLAIALRPAHLLRSSKSRSRRFRANLWTPLSRCAIRASSEQRRLASENAHWDLKLSVRFGSGLRTTQELAFAAPSNRLRIGVFGGRNDNSASWPVSNDSIRSNRVTS